MTSPVAGWYPDPSGAPGERWWNGVSWSESTRAAAAAPPPTMTKGPGPEAPHGWDGFGNPAQAPGPPPPSYGTYPPQHPGRQNDGGPSGGYGVAGPPGGYGTGGRGPADTRSWVARNGFSLATLGVTAGYLLLLVFAHLAILGLLPALLAYRAVQRRERLAWPAVAVAVLVIVFGLYEFTR